MKLFSRTFIAVMSLFLALSGCGPDPVADSLSVSQKEFANVLSDGQKLELTVTSTTNWTVSGASNWMTVTPASGQSGTTKVTIDVQANPKAEVRATTLTFKAGNLSETVTVKQVGAKILSLSTENISVDFDGKEQSVEVTASESWTAVSSAAWVKLDKTSGTTSDVVKVTVEKNEGNARTAEVTFTMGAIAKKIQVQQQGESLASIKAQERKALEAFYREAGGDSWNEKDGWLKPDVEVGDWIGIKTNDQGRVTEISLEMNNLKGKISTEITKLKKLRKLYINAALLNGSTLPANIGDLTELTTLVVKQSGVGGSVPASIKNLKKLVTLDLSTNALSGALPAELSELPELDKIDFTRNSFTGSVPESWKNLPKVKELSLAFNKGLTGSVDVLYNCTTLEYLYLHGCAFSGAISTNVKNLTKLKAINLSENNFTGNLPKELVASPDITYFGVELNRLTGTIPAEILNHPKMDWTSKWHWRRICRQQQGYGFTNCPPNPEG